MAHSWSFGTSITQNSKRRCGPRQSALAWWEWSASLSNLSTSQLTRFLCKFPSENIISWETLCVCAPFGFHNKWTGTDHCFFVQHKPWMWRDSVEDCYPPLKMQREKLQYNVDHLDGVSDSCMCTVTLCVCQELAGSYLSGIIFCELHANMPICFRACWYRS